MDTSRNPMLRRFDTPAQDRALAGATFLLQHVRVPLPLSIQPPGAFQGVGYLLQAYPRYNQTFVLNELYAHEDAGWHVPVLALQRPRRQAGALPSGRALPPARYLPRLIRRTDWLKRSIRAVALRKPGELLRTWTTARAHGLRPGVVWQACWLRKRCAGEGIRHLHCHFAGPAAYVAWCARMLGGPSYSVTVHAHELYREQANRSLLAAVLGEAAFTVAVSEYSAGTLRDELGLPAGRLMVLHNGIDLRRFPAGLADREPGTLLAVGRLVEKKGFLHLIRACAPLREAGHLRRLLILGEGEQRPLLESEVRRLGLGGCVHLPGAASQEEVAEAMRSSSVLALPSVPASDGNIDVLPTVLLEALASGTPVVASRLAGTPEIVTPEVGALVPPGHEEALVAALGGLLRDPARLEAQRKACRARAEQCFDLTHAAAQLRSRFETVLAEAATGKQ